jgi:hypothetical protein
MGNQVTSSTSGHQTITTCSKLAAASVLQVLQATSTPHLIAHIAVNLGPGSLVDCGGGTITNNSGENVYPPASYTNQPAAIATAINSAIQSAASSSNQYVSGFLNTTPMSMSTTIARSLQAIVTQNAAILTGSSCVSTISVV